MSCNLRNESRNSSCWIEFNARCRILPVIERAQWRIRWQDKRSKDVQKVKIKTASTSCHTKPFSLPFCDRKWTAGRNIRWTVICSQFSLQFHNRSIVSVSTLQELFFFKNIIVIHDEAFFLWQTFDIFSLLSFSISYAWISTNNEKIINQKLMNQDCIFIKE